MRRRPVVTILMLLIALILPLPLRAQQKPVASVAQTSAVEVCGTSLDSTPEPEGRRPSLRFEAFAGEEPRTPKSGVRAT